MGYICRHQKVLMVSMLLCRFRNPSMPFKSSACFMHPNTMDKARRTKPHLVKPHPMSQACALLQFAGRILQRLMRRSGCPWGREVVSKLTARLEDNHLRSDGTTVCCSNCFALKVNTALNCCIYVYKVHCVSSVNQANMAMTMRKANVSREGIGV